MKEKITSLLKNKRAVIFLVGAVGVMLIALSYLPGGREKAVETGAEDYVTQTEQRLTEMIESIDGAGKTKVMLTLSSDSAKVYKESLKTDSAKSEETVVVISGQNGNEALVEKTLTPEVKGVVVICEGGGKSAVKSDIITVVSAVLGVSPNRICVCKLSE